MFGCLLFECDDQATIATYISTKTARRFILRQSLFKSCSFSSFLDIFSRLDSESCNCEEIEFAYSKGEYKDVEILFTFFK